MVADNLAFTNEAKVHPSGEWLYVNETFGRQLSRFKISANGDLGPKEVVAQFDHGTFPDGLDFDLQGGVWVTSVFSNRLIRVDENGSQSTVLEDYDPDFLSSVEEMFASGNLARTALPATPARRIRNLSSSAFGGEDLRTLYLGCLQDTRIYRMESPMAGAKPPHWNVRFD
jgi:sugar lactone lactonase YvrE